MNKTEIMSKLNRTVHRTGLKLKKYSPEILVVSGIIGGVTSAVLACKETSKVSDILTDAKEQIDAIKHVVENNEDYSDEDGKKALTLTYAKAGLQITKNYAPAIALGTLSITSILAGYGILRKRYVATAAAYTILDKNFKDYRSRVIDRFGEQLDKELRYNIKAKDIETIVTNEDGTETIVKETVNEIDPTTVGDYSRFFDERCLGYEKNNPEYNLMTIKRVESYANDQLQAKGHIFLNEIYDMLGMSRTPVGAVVGWIYDPENKDIDSYVSFGKYYDPSNPDKIDFVNGREPAILLEFNCDGPIFEKI